MGLFGKKTDPLAERAQGLVDAAHVMAVGGLSPLSERHAALDSVDMGRWTFFATAATVFMAATRLNETQAWDHQGVDAFLDCKAFFDREFDRLSAADHPPQFVASDAVGAWMFWNVFQRAPESREDVELIRSAGVAVTHFACQYWD